MPRFVVSFEIKSGFRLQPSFLFEFSNLFWIPNLGIWTRIDLFQPILVDLFWYYQIDRLILIDYDWNRLVLRDSYPNEEIIWNFPGFNSVPLSVNNVHWTCKVCKRIKSAFWTLIEQITPRFWSSESDFLVIKKTKSEPEILINFREDFLCFVGFSASSKMTHLARFLQRFVNAHAFSSRSVGHRPG